MTIILNGNPHEIDSAMPVTQLLANLGLAGKPVVVELDEQAVFPRDYEKLRVSEGSRIEVVTLAAGG